MDAPELPRDRLGLEVLGVEQCWELVGASAVGRVAFVDAGEPVVLPVTHRLHGRQIVFRTAHGTKLSAAQMNAPVAFEVDEWDASTQRGWSVLVRGTAETVYDADEVAAFEAAGAVPWFDAAREGTWVRILPNEISGRRLRA
jgi:nitroimidazol reductase NimA-like FMN-containing flavoprotein (pyridoxamine 5'-phosphate oxidase superfamily)